MTETSKNPLAKLLKFLDQLDDRKIYYRLGHFRESIAVEIAVPGERWEVEFFADGHIEFERFISSGELEYPDGKALRALIKKYGDTANNSRGRKKL